MKISKYMLLTKYMVTYNIWILLSVDFSDVSSSFLIRIRVLHIHLLLWYCYIPLK